MDLVFSLALLCVISKVLSQGKCPPLVEYMYSFGKFCPVSYCHVFHIGIVALLVEYIHSGRILKYIHTYKHIHTYIHTYIHTHIQKLAVVTNHQVEQKILISY